MVTRSSGWPASSEAEPADLARWRAQLAAKGDGEHLDPASRSSSGEVELLQAELASARRDFTAKAAIRTRGPRIVMTPI